MIKTGRKTKAGGKIEPVKEPTKTFILGDRTFTEEEILLADKEARIVFNCTLIELVDKLGDKFTLKSFESLVFTAQARELAESLSRKYLDKNGVNKEGDNI